MRKKSVQINLKIAQFRFNKYDAVTVAIYTATNTLMKLE